MAVDGERLARLDRRDDGVAVLLLERPAKRNALSTRMLDDVWRCLREAAACAPEVRVVVIGGRGASFCAGADISEFAHATSSDLLDFIARGSEVFAELRGIPQPVLAAISGHALGGGAELALACDLRFASPDALIGFPEVGIGGVPGWGGTVRLQEACGRARAAELIYGGELVSAQQALKIGLVTGVVSDEPVLDAVVRRARRLAERSFTSLRMTKRALEHGSPFDPAAQAPIEQLANLACHETEDRRVAVASFLAHGRLPG